MYAPHWAPSGDLRIITAQDKTALWKALTSNFAMPGNLDETALPMLTGMAATAPDPTPYNELIAAITTNGSIRIENVRLPDPKTGNTGPDVMNIAR